MSALKHWDYSNEDLVLLHLKALCASNTTLKLIEDTRVIYNSNTKPNKVVVVSGGGSGHEPTHAGLVGDGLLDVAVVGNVFASPSAKQIISGIRSIKSDSGYLIIVKNYTGDILHFGLAAERAKADGLNIELLIVADDVAVGKTKNGMVGRRGLAGTTLVHKIAGAKAKTGASLSEVAKTGQRVIENLVTIGASLEHCSVPGRINEESLSAEEVEIGMGIHNEPGVKKYPSIPKIRSIVDELLEYLLSQTDKERSYVSFDKDDEVVLLLNGLGGTSVIELFATAAVVLEQLSEVHSIVPIRVYIGEFTTSLNGQGFSITLLNSTRAGGSEIIELLDMETNVVGWNSSIVSNPSKVGSTIVSSTPNKSNTAESKSLVTTDPKMFESILRCGLERLLSKEPEITRYDTIAGDGDCGETLAAGSNAILGALNRNEMDLSNVVESLNHIVEIIEDSMGGTSGGLYSIFIQSLAQGLYHRQESAGPYELSEAVLSQCLDDAMNSLFKYTRARRGDRTLIDTLEPFVKVLRETQRFSIAKNAAIDGSESTRKLSAKFGRASYVAEDEFKQFESEGGLPDPGAVGLAALIEGFINSYEAYARPDNRT